MAHTPEHKEVESFQTEEQRKATFDAANVIDSTVLQDSQDIQFTTPDTTTTDISGLSTDLPEIETPAADEVGGLVADVQQIIGTLADPETGKEAFTQEQREIQDFSGLRTTEEDLVAQIRGFQLQSKALENEFKLAAERIQQESLGRGRTKAGTAPLTAAAQRRITLRQADVASQALTASATLSAVQGKLVTAQRLIDEAVQKKFGALIAEKEAKIENIELLINSGVLDREERKRAEAVKAKQTKEKAELEEKKETERAVKNLTLNNAAAIANLDNGSAVLNQLLNAETEAEWLQIATESGLFDILPPTEVEKLKEDLLRAQLRKANLDITKAQIVANNAVDLGVLGSLTKDQQNAYFKLVDDYDGNSKDFFKVRDAFTRITASAEDPSPAGDVAVVFNFMKMLDPGSVVRESEFALAASTGSLNEALKNKFGKAATGEILKFTRDDFVDRANKLFDAALTQQQVLNDHFEDQANKFGIPAGNVTRAIDVANSPSGVEGLDDSDLSEIDEIYEVNPATGLFEEETLEDLFRA